MYPCSRSSFENGVVVFSPGQLVGLLGNFDGESSNDLQNIDGHVIDASESTQTIHQQFGVTCMYKTCLFLGLSYN